MLQSLLLCSMAGAAASLRLGGGRMPTPKDQEFVVRTPQPKDYMTAQDVPAALDWRATSLAGGPTSNWVTKSQNQHIPTYCGSCWAMASTSVISDRLRIARKGRWPDVIVSPQAVVHCAANGCGGGFASAVFQMAHQRGIPSETCQNYVAEGHGKECTAINICENCSPLRGCSAVHNFTSFKVSEYGQIGGEDAMIKEIAARGPIACGIDAGPIENWGLNVWNTPAAKKVWSDPRSHHNIDHEISVVGYGTTAEGQKYWVVRNSWGTYWGDNGFFLLERGTNQLGIESHNNCDWAVPIVPAGF